MGASGFVGRHVAAYLKNQGHEIIGTASSGRHGLIPFKLESERIYQKLPADFFNSDTPIHAVICAVMGNIDRCASEKELAYRINVEGTRRLLEDLNSLKVKIVYLSSSWVFDGVGGPYAEHHHHAPVNEYGRHKSIVEKFVTAHLPDATVLRLDKIVGANAKERHLFSEWYDWTALGKPIICIAGQLMTPTFVEDVARAVHVATTKNLKGLYNVANTEAVSRVELAERFLAALKLKGAIRELEQSMVGLLEKRPLRTALDSTSFIAAAKFQFTPLQNVFASFRNSIS